MAGPFPENTHAYRKYDGVNLQVAMTLQSLQLTANSVDLCITDIEDAYLNIDHNVVRQNTDNRFKEIDACLELYEMNRIHLMNKIYVLDRKGIPIVYLDQ